jgi:extracellular factor (EF) 3-hydroxypalmitic acid methyl ester biosynthesis protein
MQALSCTNEVDNTPETGTLTLLYDRVRRSFELGLIKEGLDDLCGGLEHIRNAMEPGAWRAFAAGAREDRTLGDFLYQDPLTRRAFDKPRGYAGDAIMMDYVYGIHGGREAVAQASDVGGAICRCIRQRPAPESVRYRRAHIAELIDGIAAAQPQPTILAIASGHLREAELSTALASSRVGKFVALDVDADSLREVETQYATLGVETVHASVRSILARKIELGSFDFVYAAGLYDYLNDSTAAALTARLFELTNPGGQLLIPNFAPCCPDRAYLETFMAWDLTYRDEFDMAKIVASLPSERIASYDIYSDPSRSIVYLMIRKAKPASANLGKNF